MFIAFLFQLESLKECQNIKNASQKSKDFLLRRMLIFLFTLGIYRDASEIYNSNTENMRRKLEEKITIKTVNFIFQYND